MRQTMLWLMTVVLLACGEDAQDGASAVDGLYLFPCDEDAPSCDGVQDAIWLEDGLIYKGYAELDGDIVCTDDARGTYETTATGIRVTWYGDDETPAREEEVAIVDGVLETGDRPEKVPGKRRVGSESECRALDDDER